MKYVAKFFKVMIREVLRPLSFAPALCMMYIIFQFSSATGVESSGTSGSVCLKIVDTADEALDLNVSYNKRMYYAEKLEYPVRKLAHFGEYALLAATVALPLYVYGMRGIPLMLVAGAICVGFACTDEYHQSFVSGRSPSKKDVLIDSAGAFCGIIFTRIVGFIGRKTIFRPLCEEKKKRRERNDS
jgi:VanZ family protein